MDRRTRYSPEVRERPARRLRSRSEADETMAPLSRDSLARPSLSQCAGTGFLRIHRAYRFTFIAEEAANSRDSSLG